MKALALLLFHLTLVFSAISAPLAEPVIETIRGRNVFVRVPAGFEKITLQQSIVPRTPELARRNERWRTVATNYPRGLEKLVKIHLPTLIGKRFLRVVGTASEPLDGDLLTGLSTFLPDPIESSGGYFPVSPVPGGAVAFTDGNSAGGRDTSGGSTPDRTVTESDIWKVQGDRLYFYNELRGLQVFDVTQPDSPTLLGQLRMPGSGEEMYLLGNTHAVLLKQSFGGTIRFTRISGWRWTGWSRRLLPSPQALRCAPALQLPPDPAAAVAKSWSWTSDKPRRRSPPVSPSMARSPKVGWSARCFIRLKCAPRGYERDAG